MTKTVIPPSPSFPSRFNRRKDGGTYTYPQDGALIGPAWELAWELLARSVGPMGQTELAAVVAWMRGDIAISTVMTLINDAREEGVIYSENVKGLAGPGKVIVSCQPIDVEAFCDQTPPSYRAVREVMTRYGSLPKFDIFERVRRESPVSKDRLSFVWNSMIKNGYVISDNEGHTWRWAGR